MNIINLIRNKPDYERKLNNNEIVSKWKNELVSQGANLHVVNTAIKLINEQLKIKNKEDYQEDFFGTIAKYNWILPITVNLKNDIGLGCDQKCKCGICSGLFITSNNLSDYNEDNSISYEDALKIKCTCKPLINRDKLKQKYLDKFIVKSKIKNNLNFPNIVKEYQKNKIVDYHPGTHNTVIDIIHPSIYCYVDGLTLLKNFKIFNNLPIIQWIPANFSTNEKKFTSKINNCDMDDNKLLYNTISKIFLSSIKKFQKIFNILYENKKITNEIILSDYNDLQVIVKIGSTELTPENPKSKATSWHLEGIREENIIGTAIYYYDMNNVTDSYLNFRSVIDEEPDYEQCQYYSVEQHYGLSDVENQDMTETDVILGKIKTKKDMLLIFPNFLQHKVEEFELIDKTLNGNRSILVFFLIDPRQKIISTADITDNHMPLEVAKMFRELIMFQRSYTANDQQNFYERGWSLCEH
jgi:hypothetical protein